jgi:hypothetical protein
LILPIFSKDKKKREQKLLSLVANIKEEKKFKKTLITL